MIENYTSKYPTNEIKYVHCYTAEMTYEDNVVHCSQQQKNQHQYIRVCMDCMPTRCQVMSYHNLLYSDTL